MSVAAAMRPLNEYGPGAIDEYNPPFAAAPYAVPVVDSIHVVEQSGFGGLEGGEQLVELIAVNFVSLAVHRRSRQVVELMNAPAVVR